MFPVSNHRIAKKDFRLRLGVEIAGRQRRAPQVPDRPEAEI